MAIGGDYANPVYVNGYQCWNCSQVAEAKKGINPAQPNTGVEGPQPKAGSSSASTPSQGPAVTFGGALAGSSPGTGAVKPSGLVRAGVDLTV